MDTQQSKQAVLDEMKHLMTDPDLAKRLGVREEHLHEALMAEDWANTIGRLLEQIPTDMRALVEFIARFLQRIPVDLPSENWALTVYTIGSHRLFPDNFNDYVSEKIDVCVDLTLEITSLFIDHERLTVGYLEGLDFEPLSGNEVVDSPYAVEYQRLLDSWNELYIQEILRLGRVATYFDLLGHIAGVYKIAITMGRQMVARDVPVDLCLLCGAAMVHDIGKFGSRNEEEVQRMAYLHYYYTDQWCNWHGLPEIGHIAMNHSTWDLELENLSAESLVLIYADFRVKAMTGRKTEKEIMHIYSLEESFDVILNKLDNVDEKKRQRYQRVYYKLMDFQIYMQSLGIVVSLNEDEVGIPEPEYLGMMDATDSPRIFKNLAVKHNISIMHILSDKEYLAVMLERLRANDSSVDIRAHLNVLEEYMTYMSKSQKLLIFNYLMEMLIHPEGDIRRQAARLIGAIIPNYDEPYRKELPSEVMLDVPEETGMSLWRFVLDEVFSPDLRIGDRYLRWRGYALQHVMRAVMDNCASDECINYLAPLLQYYRRFDYSNLVTFILLDVSSEIPLDALSDEDWHRLLDFTLAAYQRDDIEVSTASLLFLEALFHGKTLKEADQALTVDAFAASSLDNYSLCYLRNQLAEETGIAAFHPPQHCDRPAAEIFLENLKSSTSWITKVVNIRRLSDAVATDDTVNRLHIALHFSNLLKVSEQIAVRHDAGKALVTLAPSMSPEEINEVVVELTRGLEMDSFEFTKYIPEYLARLVTFLGPKEFDEMVSAISKLVDSVNDSTAQLALDTLAHIVADMETATAYIDDDDRKFQNRLSRIMGVFMKGLATYRRPVQVETLSILGKTLFGNDQLSLAYKAVVFDHIYKRLLMLIIEDQETTQLLFYGHSTTLNHVYRFLSDYDFFVGELPLGESRQVAFFPGTFDPFTLGHKGIVRLIRDQSFDVYLGVDEFSWSKNIQPSLIRRKIMQMSLAEEENVFLFPSGFPVNLANEADLLRLKALFPNKDVYIVVGSDVIFNASAYTTEPTDSSVHNFNHILIDREEDAVKEKEWREKSSEIISGKVKLVTLPAHLEQISSTVIRENIAYHRDISHLIDRMAQNYIYENNLYLGEPKFKPVFQPKPAEVTLVETDEGAFWSSVGAFLGQDSANPLAFLSKGTQPLSRLVVEKENGALNATALVQLVQTGELYTVFGDRKIANRLRELGASSMAVLSDLRVRDVQKTNTSGQQVLTEALLWAIEEMATYCIYRGQDEKERHLIGDLLKRQGFVPFFNNDDDQWFYIVNMRSPMLLAQNTETRIKEPYRSQPLVQQAMQEASVRLQSAIKDFEPGHLVLSYNSLTLQEKLVKMITQDNGVPSVQAAERVTGPAMCVPFGNLLRHAVVPNTVTRPLFVQRVYDADMEHYNIGTMPFYDDLESQIRIIRSFNRPLILTEEVFNRGRTLEQLHAMIRTAGIDILSADLGIITGAGKDLLTELNCPFHFVHYIPKIKHWFVDSKGYPFIDGYCRKDRDRIIKGGLQKSVNPVLPYAASLLYREMDMQCSYQFSRVSLENALMLMETLETVYQQLNQRSLTLNRLPEVIVNPVSPDLGAQIFYDYSLNASAYIEKDLQNLSYLQNLVYSAEQPPLR